MASQAQKFVKATSSFCNIEKAKINCNCKCDESNSANVMLGPTCTYIWN